jgi:hypothetical protein
MNVITDTLRQIVRRKLWPVALLLVAALAAVPLVLAKQPEADTVAQAANAKTVEPLPATFVSAETADTADATATAKRRRVLGAQKDPFAPAELPKVKKKKTSAKKDSTDAPAGDKPATDEPSASGGTGGAATPPVSAAPTPAPVPTVTIPAFSVKVRFGSTEGETELDLSTIERLSVLPDEANPVVVYRGVVDDGKAAIFELTGDVEAEGDATCAPTPEDCQYIKLRAGETEFLTVSDTVTDTGEAATEAQFQLDLVKIYKKQTKEKKTDATATAAQPLTKASSSALGSKAFPLRRRNRYVFDATTGLLHRAPKGAKTPLSAL